MCAGTYYGQELYKVTLLTIAATIFGQLILRFVYFYWFNKKKEFLVADAVLAIVYIQSVVWVSVMCIHTHTHTHTHLNIHLRTYTHYCVSNHAISHIGWYSSVSLPTTNSSHWTTLPVLCLLLHCPVYMSPSHQAMVPVTAELIFPFRSPSSSRVCYHPGIHHCSNVSSSDSSEGPDTSRNPIHLRRNSR